MLANSPSYNSLAIILLIDQTASMPRSTRTRFLNIFLCLWLSSLPFTCLAQSSWKDFPPNLTEIIQSQINWDHVVPNQKNPSGLRFKFSKIDVAPSHNGHLVRYRAYVLGASEKRKYALGIWKIGGDLQNLPVDVYVNAKGLLLAHPARPDEENSEILTDGDELDIVTQAAPGEPVRFALTTSDGKFLVPGTIVPFPLESKGASCRIELRLVEPAAQAILIYANGLPPNSEIPFETISGGEPKSSKFSVNAKGHAVTTDLPFVVGKDTGTLKVSVATKECLTSVEIPWGKDTYRAF